MVERPACLGYLGGIRWLARQENSELFFTQPERHIRIEADEAVLQRYRKKSSRIVFTQKVFLIVLKIIRTSPAHSPSRLTGQLARPFAVYFFEKILAFSVETFSLRKGC